MKNKFFILLSVILLTFAFIGCNHDSNSDPATVAPSGGILGDIPESGVITLWAGMGTYTYTYSNKTFPPIILPVPEESALFPYDWENKSSPMVAWAYFSTGNGYTLEYRDKDNNSIEYCWWYSDKTYAGKNITFSSGWNFMKWSLSGGIENASFPVNAEWIAQLYLMTPDVFSGR